MTDATNWSNDPSNKVGHAKMILGNLAQIVRTNQYRLFSKIISPTHSDSVLDVGTSPNEDIKGTNQFENLYPYKDKLTISSVEDCKHLVKKYKVKEFILLEAGKKLPFRDNQFDVVTSWATLEHVGGPKQQQFFLKELARVGKKIYVTTPYKYCIYEPHTQMFFLHWLPNTIYRIFLKLSGNSFWASEDKWNALGQDDIKKMLPPKCSYRLYNMFGIIPSHLIVYKTQN
jgi:hypothetical protein